MKRWMLLSDDDGHHYLVPAESEDAFNEWVDSFRRYDESDGNTDEDYPDPDGYSALGAISLGCSPTCVTFTDPEISGRKI